MPFKLNGNWVFVQLDKDESMDPFDFVFGIAENYPETPITEIARIMKEYKEWKDEHETTA